MRGYVDKRVDAEANSSEGDQQDEELVAKNPSKRNIVGAQQAVEGVFGKPIETIVLAGFVAKEAGAHHGCRGERNEQRHGDGHAEDDGEFTEKAAADYTHKKNRNE